MYYSKVISDEQVWDLWLSNYLRPVVAIADSVGVFESIHAGHASVDAVAKHLCLDSKGVECLTCVLAGLQLLIKNNDSLKLAEVSERYWLKDSDYYWGPAFDQAHTAPEYLRIHAVLLSNSKHLELDGNKFTDMWQKGKIDAKSAEKFTQVMQSTIYPAVTDAVNANVFEHVNHIMDVGAGSGCFVKVFLEKYPTAQASIFELPEVSEIARNYLDKNNLGHRVTVYNGSFFEDELPRVADGIFLSNILHDWPVDIAKKILQKVYLALPVGGQLFIHEMLLNESRNGPLTVAIFHLLMYLNHGSQQFTQSELEKMLLDIGFSECREYKTHPHYSVIVARK